MGESGGGARSKLLVVALMAALVGVPAWVLFSIVTTSAEVYGGAQPGGVVRGVVRRADGGGVEGVAVRAVLSRWSENERAVDGGPTVVEETWRVVTSGIDGRFEIELPPHEGFYALRAEAEGGEAEVTRALSWLAKDGGVGEVVLELP